ncbi:hypothetical protein BDY17DRAFT_322507 [Neohortaea acidophila]|uniref:Uncharacterized protein n=1 Tax=Neohortaea acidophila TaxID=245834 RepID=A0A6A6Q098_9PEZI|nr:uncharacterized protein BDY17DRAFT_322507 [Neohortaea acidophila]KAF2485685.1 hypothetical protein BDY17DRAFT_322507 [Neohortaea acidophila]
MTNHGEESTRARCSESSQAGVEEPNLSSTAERVAEQDTDDNKKRKHEDDAENEQAAKRRADEQAIKRQADEQLARLNPDFVSWLRAQGGRSTIPTGQPAAIMGIEPPSKPAAREEGGRVERWLAALPSPRRLFDPFEHDDVQTEASEGDESEEEDGEEADGQASGAVYQSQRYQGDEDILGD